MRFSTNIVVSTVLIAILSQPPAIEDFYCETSYINFAWGYQHHGSYMDGQGRVFTFGSRSSDARITPWQPAQPGAPTQRELDDKYRHKRQQVGTVDAQKLNEVSRWLADARNGSLSKKVQRGADMGATVRACWIRETGGERYREIVLVVDGDWSYRNTAPAAAELARWLASALEKE